MNIGDKLKQIREIKGLSLRDIAEKSGLSASFIGQVERNETSPSMRSIKNITDALGIKLADILIDIENQEEEPTNVVTLEQRRRVENLLKGVDMYYLTPEDNKNILGAILYAKPGSSSGEDYSLHGGEEFGYIISGTLWFWVGDKEYNLREGDSISFSSMIPHKWENRSMMPSISLWVSTPPAY